MMYKNNFVAVIKSSGSILRETGSTVYLKYGSEYSILLKNKDSRKASVSIEVDGEDVLDGHRLIVPGNTTQEVKGFMRNMNETNRFRFIHKTKQIQKHRGDRIDDGLVRITYKFEKDPIVFGNPLPIYRKISEQREDNISGLTHTYYSNTKSSDAVYGGFVTSSCLSSSPMANEGITVKGQKINENFEYGSIGPLEFTENVIIIQLKGATSTGKKVKKSMTVKTRIACETCGSKNKSNNNFCWKCGTYLK